MNRPIIPSPEHRVQFSRRDCEVFSPLHPSSAGHKAAFAASDDRQSDSAGEELLARPECKPATYLGDQLVERELPTLGCRCERFFERRTTLEIQQELILRRTQ